LKPGIPFYAKNIFIGITKWEKSTSKDSGKREEYEVVGHKGG
jgi:hypothetical protein